MAIPHEEFLARLPEGERRAVAARTAELVAEERTLRELREAYGRSQAELAKRLGIKRAAMSRLERRADLYVSTLRGLIRAIGGEMEIVARFADRPPVRISLREVLHGTRGKKVAAEPESRPRTAGPKKRKGTAPGRRKASSE